MAGQDRHGPDPHLRGPALLPAGGDPRRHASSSTPRGWRSRWRSRPTSSPPSARPASRMRPRDPLPAPAAFSTTTCSTRPATACDTGLGGLLELGGFHGSGNLVSSFRLQDLTASPSVTRLDTTLSRDLPDSRSTVRLGDSIASGGALAPPVRFAGLQYATNFGTDPTFVTFPLPTIGGLARQDSVVDVFIDNVQREARSVPTGPFTLDSLPVVTGAGEVQLRVTDLLGREQLVTQSYYVSSRLLKQGLHDFGYQLGAERRDYGTRELRLWRRPGLRHASLRLHRPAHRRGPWRAGARPAEPGTRWLPTCWASTAWSAAASAPGTAMAGPGVLGELGYEYDGRRFSFGARTPLHQRRLPSGRRRRGGGARRSAQSRPRFRRQGAGGPAGCSIATAATPRTRPPWPPPTASPSGRAR